MRRRRFLQSGMAAWMGSGLVLKTAARGELSREGLDAAADVLARATASGQVAAAVLHVVQRDKSFTRHFGTAESADAMFLLGSISKPVCVTALMTLFDKGEFRLDDRLRRFIPEFTGDGRDDVTMQHLLSHVSGLPDQLPDNNDLRARHAPLSEFVHAAVRTPLHFKPGTQYQYSSMGILLATHVAEILGGDTIHNLVDRVVFQALDLKHSAQGLGRFRLSDMVPVQTEHAAPESGAGDPSAKNWDWNSEYWRKLGAPWGTTHMSAPDIGRFLDEFLHKRGRVVKPETAALMTRNHNKPDQTSRGLGFNVGAAAGSSGCSDRTFGHTGSTGTLAWADPVTQTTCVVLTSLPGRAVTPHPRQLVGEQVAAATQ